MPRRKYNKKNYNYPKENDADDTSKNDKEKKQLKRKKKKKLLTANPLMN